MKKKTIWWILGILLLLVALSYGIWFFCNQPKPDENELYSKQFGNTILKFEKYDVVLGQRMLVGVEKSTNKGKTYTRITDDLITVSNEAQFLFLSETLAFARSTSNVMQANQFSGLYVSQDGGSSFESAKFEYENPRIEIMTMEGLPYYDGDVLKLACSIYDVNATQDGYENIPLIFTSTDQGLTWHIIEA